MKKLVSLFNVSLALLLLSCTDDESTTAQFLNADRGAILRTVEFRSAEFRVNDPESFIDILIEEQDEEDGDLLDYVEVYVAFQDNTSGGTDLSKQEVLFDIITIDRFARTGQVLEPLGHQPLFQTVLSYTFDEVMEALSLPTDGANCGDQVLIRTELCLTDGRSFSRDDISAFTGGFGTFSSSSFCYTINIVEPIEPELFTGTYLYESILDGFRGPSFGPSRVVEVEKGHSENVRLINFTGANPHGPHGPFEFTISCESVIVQKLQLVQFLRCGSFGNVLYGPDTVNAPVNLDDDSVFEVWFVEGDSGFDGECGFGTLPSRFRLSRQ